MKTGSLLPGVDLHCFTAVRLSAPERDCCGDAKLPSEARTGTARRQFGLVRLFN